MAVIVNNFPLIRGKVGDNVYKIRNGKVVVCAAPKKYKASKTKAAVSGRENFTFFAKLAKTVTSSFVLNYFWKALKIPGLTAQNKIYKYFNKAVKEYDLSNVQLFEDDNLFYVNLKSITRNVNVIDIVISPPGEEEGISVFKNPLIAAQGLIFLYNPAYKRKEKFLFIPVSSPDIETSLDNDLSFRFRILKSEAHQFTLYPERKMLFNLALKDSSGKPARCSYTIYYSF